MPRPALESVLAWTKKTKLMEKLKIIWSREYTGKIERDFACVPLTAKKPLFGGKKIFVLPPA